MSRKELLVCDGCKETADAGQYQPFPEDWAAVDVYFEGATLTGHLCPGCANETVRPLAALLKTRKKTT